jgi:hypothetical protein
MASVEKILFTTEDDLILIESVKMFHSFDEIALNVPFSVYFSPEELSQRWHHLLRKGLEYGETFVDSQSKT